MDFKFDEKTGKITNYIGNSKDVVIPEEIEGVKVKIIGESAFKGKGLKSVVLPEGLEEIWYWAFERNELTSIEFPKSIKVISCYSFKQNRLTSVVIPDGVTKLENGEFMANQLTSVTLSKNLKVVGHESFANNKISSIDWPENLIEINTAAFEYNSLTQITIPNSVTTIGSGAFGRNQLTEVEIPSSVTVLKGGLSGGVFENNHLRTVKLNEGIIEIGDGAFKGNVLTSITIPKTVTKIEGNCFDGNELKTVNVEYDDVAKESRLNKMWKNAYLPMSQMPGIAEENGYWFDTNSGTILKYLGGLTELVIPNEIAGVKVRIVDEKVFKSKRLTKVTLPDTLEIIKEDAFESNLLEELIIPDSVTVLERSAFEDNYLRKVTLSKNLVEIGFRCFYYNALQEVNIPNGVKDIGKFSFTNNPVKIVKLPKSLEGLNEEFINKKRMDNVVNNVARNLYNYTDEEVVDTLINLLKFTKINETTILEILSSYPQFEKRYKELAESKVKKMKTAGIYLLKTIKVRNLLNKSVEEKIEYINQPLEEVVLKKLDLVDFGTVPKLKFKDGQEADIQLVKNFVGAFLTSKEMIVPPENKLLEAMFDKEDLTKLGQFILDEWIKNDMDNKLKTALVLSTYYADEQMIYQVKDLVNKMILDGRYKSAQQILQAIAYNGSKISFLLLDQIANKGKTKGQKEEASRLLIKAARVNNVSYEQLLDMIVPDFGFNNDGVLKLSNDEVCIDIMLEDDGKLIYKDDEGKITKTLPKKVDCFKKEVNALKKQIKTVYQSQTDRLEGAYLSGRTWDKDAFVDLFVNNPFMRQVSSGLIFGFENSRGEKLTFTVTKEKGLETAGYDEVNLDSNAKVYLIHGTEENSDTLEAWKTYLKDNELSSKLDQLTVMDFEIKTEDSYKITNFYGYVPKEKGIELRQLQQKLLAIGFEKDNVDNSHIFNFFMKIKSSTIIVNISFNLGFYIEVDLTKEVEVGSLYFTSQQNMLPLNKVPKRLIVTIGHKLSEIFK